jgi:hypothetical protein
VSRSYTSKGRKKWAARRDADFEAAATPSIEAAGYRRALRWWVAPPLPPELPLDDPSAPGEFTPRLMLRRRWSVPAQWEQ